MVHKNNQGNQLIKKIMVQDKVMEHGAIIKNDPKNYPQTGSWKGGIVPVVDKKKCIGCGNCVNNCPEECYELVNKKAAVNLDFCKGCAICVNVCPVKAIRI